MLTSTALRSDTFIFRYDPNNSFESMMEEFWQAVDGKFFSDESNVIRSNSLAALSDSMNEHRLQIFALLVKKQPNNLEELAQLLGKDYDLIQQEAKILAGMGLIKLEGTKPIALYRRVIFDFPMIETTQS